MALAERVRARGSDHELELPGTCGRNTNTGMT